MTTTLAAPPAFALLGDLPTGTTVLEASAGTGKTFTIATLVARYVAEGVATMEQLLVVSFSRESTRELRERVRERLVTARDRLRDPAAAPADDVLIPYLAADPALVPERIRLLEEALATFDAATVTTTHGFCQQVLLTLGTAGDSDPGAVLLESIRDVVTEVADDLYLRKWGSPGAEPAGMPRKDFLKLASEVAGDPATALLPDPATVSDTPLLRVRIATAVGDEVERRKRRRQLMSYDDLLLRVAATLADPESGPPAAARLRARYRIVLVDEFQDTDPVQWSILHDAFHGHRTLVLIGDPKQAIYRFRGADVHSYLAAVEAAESMSTLPTNWRSDPALLQGLEAVFRGAALGDPRIRVRPVTAAHPGRMIDVPAPVRLRVLPRDGLDLNQDGTAKAGDAKEAIARDLAVEVVQLLSGGTRVRPRDGSGERTVEPGDVAVLVRTNSQAQLVQEALSAASVPVVVTGRTNVFTTVAAAEWQVLLEALEQPHRSPRVRRLALSCFGGLSAAELDRRGDTYADDLALRVRQWGKVLEERGVAALFEAVSISESLQPRVLGTQGGERLLTDLRHLTEVLHGVALEERLGLTALLGWLRRRREEALDKSRGTDGTEERSRRLESDADAVQVLTIHTSKGLEFPVVLVPFAWDGWKPGDPATAAFHEGHRRVRDVGGPGSPDWGAHVAQHKLEEIDDELRLAYVAFTRAQGALLLWWAPTKNTPQSPLQRLMLHDDPAAPPPRSIAVPGDADALATLRTRAAQSNGALVVEVVTPRPAAAWAPPRPAPSVLSPATFERVLDTGWRRTSYSALTAGTHETSGLGSEPEQETTDDESSVPELPELPAPATDAHLREVRSAWDELPAGAAFGTLVHAVIERLDDHAMLGEGLASVVAEQTARYGLPDCADGLTAALSTALATPLGPLTGGASLGDIKAADRLPEMDFELPLAGGDEPHAEQVVLSDLVPLWRRHCPTGLLSSYGDRLAELEPAPLRGYLTGSIDAVLRVPEPGTGPGKSRHRYLVVDYKTNRLGVPGEPLTAWHYGPAALEQAMIEAHYPLQALLYGVALHRYLRWRDPAYDPETSLGGVLYLFLRGMSGPGLTGADGSVPGVFSWKPPGTLVTAASDLLAGEPA